MHLRLVKPAPPKPTGKRRYGSPRPSSRRQHDRLAWDRRGALVRWLAVVAYRHGLAHLRREELRARYEGTHVNEPIGPSAEERYLVREALALAARATSAARWRTLRAWASGIDVADIARREPRAHRSAHRLRLDRSRPTRHQGGAPPPLAAPHQRLPRRMKMPPARSGHPRRRLAHATA